MKKDWLLNFAARPTPKLIYKDGVEKTTTDVNNPTKIKGKALRERERERERERKLRVFPKVYI